MEFSTAASPGVGTSATGRGGDINISADNLIFENARIEASTQGAGAAGSVNIRAANAMSLNASTILSDPQPGSTGTGGNVTLQTPQLFASNRSLISASTFAAGDAGDLVILGDRMTFNNSLVTTQTRDAGNAGDIRVNAQQLRLQNGTQFVGSSFGGSNAGNLAIQADQLEISGLNSTVGSSGLFSVIDANTIGQGGNISIEAGQLRLENRGLISTGTLGQGNAGNVEIRADRVNINTGLIQASTGVLNFFGSSLEQAAIGNSGNITIRANQMDLNNASIRTQVGSQARGNAGNIAGGAAIHGARGFAGEHCHLWQRQRG